MIQVDKLTKYFGPILAVDHASFEVAKGEIVGFLGLNGAGKTTTMRMLTTFLPATSGIARVAGYDVMSQSMDVRRNIGYLPESIPLYTEMRVEEYLDYRAKLKGVERKDRTKRIEHSLDRCRIREVRRRLIGTLSKGYRQRVGLADAMVHDPPILIMDEPTVGLDPMQIRETLNMIKDLGKKHTILFSTHILSEVEAICERVIIIYKGRIALDKKLNELATEAAVIVVEIRGPAEQITNVLRTTDGIEHVMTMPAGDGVTSYEIRTRHDQDLREVIFQRMAKNGWPIRKLDLRRRKLEDHFVNVIMGDTSAYTPAPIRPTSTAVQPASSQTAVSAPSS